MAITFTVMSVYTRLQARTSIPLDMRPRSVTARRPVTTIDRAVVLLSAGFMLFVLLAPLAALLWQSVTLGGQGITLDYYQELTINRRQSAFYVSPLTAVRNSLFFALVTVVLSLALGAISAYLCSGRAAVSAPRLTPSSCCRSARPPSPSATATSSRWGPCAPPSGSFPWRTP